MLVCHSIFNYHRGCGHHTQDRTVLAPRRNQSLDSHHIIRVPQHLHGCTQFHSVYIICQPESKWNQTDAWPGDRIFRRTDWHGSFNFFLLRKHRSSVSLSFALINFTGENVRVFFSSNYMLHLLRSQRSMILPFVGRAGVHPACPAAHTWAFRPSWQVAQHLERVRFSDGPQEAQGRT